MKYKVGDKLVYRKAKCSTHPGPRARVVRPSEHGEFYTYTVDKQWTVSAIIDETTIEVVTRRGKRHQIKVDDPCLHRVRITERLRYRGRFPELESTPLTV